MGKIDNIFNEYKDTDKFKVLPLFHRYQKADLKKKHRTLGDAGFQRGFRQNAFSQEDVTFKHVHQGIRLDIGQDIINTNSMVFFGGVDISTSKRPGNVMFTLGVDQQGIRYKAELIRGKFSSPEFASKIFASYEFYKHQVILVENNAVQEMLIDWLGYNARYINFQGFHTGKQKMNPDIGPPSLDVEFQNNMWVFPCRDFADHDHVNCDCNECTFLKEFEHHPHYGTSDIVMASWFAREAVRKYWNTGFIVESGEFV